MAKVATGPEIKRVEQMIKVLFFAAIREQLDCEELELKLNAEANTICDIKASLSEKGADWQKVFTDPTLLVAVNQTMVDDAQSLKSNDTVAFFPPVTGG
ncbi:hypothetical protein ND16A_3377 [Thalassotalea sp. ND16A]|nr:hypothetical protein ND16A_3377 [Thalassotalea sp. ND16A]